MRRFSPLIAILFTVFIDMLAFGIVIPDIQLRGENLGAHSALRGLILASFSIAQMAFAPILGRFSDQFGRRRALVITCLLTVLSFIAYAYALNLGMLLASRILGGIAGANLSISYAYIADVTPKEDRGKAMGMVGAAFGMGFILGPPLGLLLKNLGHGSPFWIGWVAAAIAFCNFLYVYFYLPEPEKHEETSDEDRHIGRQILKALKTPTLGTLILLFFAATFAFSNLESTFFLLCVNHLHLDQGIGIIVLIVVGIVQAGVQGGLLRVVLPKFGESKLLRFGYLLQAPIFASIPWVWVFGKGAAFGLIGGAMLLGIGSGLAQPCLSSLISKQAPRNLRGSIFGITHGVAALGRILGPIVANSLLDVSPYYPYYMGGALLLIPLAGFILIKFSEATDEEQTSDLAPAPS